jgi:hypothetical protein
MVSITETFILFVPTGVRMFLSLAIGGCVSVMCPIRLPVQRRGA